MAHLRRRRCSLAVSWRALPSSSTTWGREGTRLRLPAVAASSFTSAPPAGVQAPSGCCRWERVSLHPCEPWPLWAPVRVGRVLVVFLRVVMGAAAGAVEAGPARCGCADQQQRAMRGANVRLAGRPGFFHGPFEREQGESNGYLCPMHGVLAL